MDRAEELKIGKRIDSIHEKIRYQVLHFGWCPAYHIQQAQQGIANPKALEPLIELAKSDIDLYLEQLASLIMTLKRDEAECVRLWQKSGFTKKFQAARQKTIATMLQFNFRGTAYDSFARRIDTTYLRMAREILNSKEDRYKKEKDIANFYRMPMKQFVDTANELERLTAEVDALRDNYRAATTDFALKQIRGTHDQALEYAALLGLWKASRKFEASRGYRFNAYAQWWVKAALADRKERIRESRSTVLELPIPELLKRHTLFLQHHAEPCIGFDLTQTDLAEIGSSKIGGAPDLPKKFKWPVHNRRKLDFLLQINLSDLKSLPRAKYLPPRGMLSFFYDLKEQPWGYDPKNLSGSKVIFTPSLARLSRGEIPDSELSLKEMSLRFKAGQSLPYTRSRAFSKFRAQSPFTDQEYDAYWDYVHRVETVGQKNSRDDGKHRLFGHSSNIQGDMQLKAQLVTNGLYCGDSSGYDDPRRKILEKGADDWLLLLQLDSDDKGKFMWGDAGMLYFWIRKQDLKARRFNRVWMTLQCS